MGVERKIPEADIIPNTSEQPRHAFNLLKIQTDVHEFLLSIKEEDLLIQIQETGNINAFNKKGKTLLMLVVEHKNANLFRLLLKTLEHKDIYFKNELHKDAIDMAIGLGDAGLLAVLKEFNLIEPVKDAGVC